MRISTLNSLINKGLLTFRFAINPWAKFSVLWLFQWHNAIAYNGIRQWCATGCILVNVIGWRMKVIWANELMRHLYSVARHSCFLVILGSTPHSHICLPLLLSSSLSLSLCLCSSRHIWLQVVLCTSGTDRLIWGRWKKSVYSPGPRQEWIHWRGGAQVRVVCVRVSLCMCATSML